MDCMTMMMKKCCEREERGLVTDRESKKAVIV